MGIAGHILNDKNLRKLNEWSGRNFRRAYNRNGYGGACLQVSDRSCIHFSINFRKKTVSNHIDYTDKWTSCPR